jgi:hypothetical protein
MQLWQCKVCTGSRTGKDIATNSLFQVKVPTHKEIGAVCGCFYYVPGLTGKEIGACVAVYNVPGSTLHRIIRWKRREVVYNNYAVRLWCTVQVRR